MTGDIRNSDRDQPPLPYAYVPYTRAVADAMAVFIRTDGEPTQIASAVREAVSRVDATQPVYAVRSMAQVLVDDNLAGLVLVRVLVGLALVAIALATSGVYAILSYAVGRRTSEIGVRIALGATRQQSVGLVVRDGLSYAVVGVTLGMLGAWGAARLSASQLFGVTPSDPATFLLSALVILFAVTAASWAPARAAARLSPLAAMRRD